jgi:hypothetical protein
VIEAASGAVSSANERSEKSDPKSITNASIKAILFFIIYFLSKVF